MSGSGFDLAVVGAGVMGLGCALAAAKEGRKVAVLDPSQESAKSSWAAAGILVTRDAHNFLSPFREFYVRSIHMYPAWLGEIAGQSGIAVPLHRGGDHLIYDLDSEPGLEQYQAKLKQLDREHSRAYTVTDELPSFLRGFSRLGKVKAFHFPGEAYVQNRDLLAALQAACLKAGVHTVVGSASGAWDYSAGRSRIPLDDGEIEARQVLLSAGAWSGKVLEGLGIAAPMIPVKGQLRRIRKFYPEGSMVHFNDDIYLVPRGDSLIVGATTEPGVWREGFDATGEEYLGGHLERLLPDISKEPIENWSGFRPRTKDRLPWMGWIDIDRGWAICTGHYKCGLSMAPLAALCMTRLMMGEKPPVDLTPFHPWRPKGLAKGLVKGLAKLQ